MSDKDNEIYALVDVVGFNPPSQQEAAQLRALQNQLKEQGTRQMWEETLNEFNQPPRIIEYLCNTRDVKLGVFIQELFYAYDEMGLPRIRNGIMCDQESGKFVRNWVGRVQTALKPTPVSVPVPAPVLNAGDTFLGQSQIEQRNRTRFQNVRAGVRNKDYRSRVVAGKRLSKLREARKKNAQRRKQEKARSLRV